MNRSWIYLLVIHLLVVCSPIVMAGDSEKAPAYDAALAKRLGADERGMKQYVLVILKTGPKDASIQGKERDEIFAGHFSNIERLANEGKLIVAGPFGKNDLQFRGLFIFHATSVEEAQKLAGTDPAVKAGILELELIPWYGSASLMATPEIHKQIAKTNP